MKTKIVIMATDNKTFPADENKAETESAIKDLYDLVILNQLREYSDKNDDMKWWIDSVEITDD
jgi:hypothetical protein